MIRVGIADDQELVRHGIRMILESEDDLAVVGEAGDGRAAVELVARERVDVLLLDVQMPEQDGLAAAREILATGTTTRVLMLTTFDLDEYVYEALRVGAAGFLLKDMSGEDIVTAVRKAGAGADSLLAPAVTRRLIERFTSAPPATAGSHRALQQLTGRELEVLRLIARGISNAEIATALSISETTVKTHVTRLLMKLGLRDRLQATILAYEAGIVTASRPATEAAAGPPR